MIAFPAILPILFFSLPCSYSPTNLTNIPSFFLSLFPGLRIPHASTSRWPRQPLLLPRDDDGTPPCWSSCAVFPLVLLSFSLNMMNYCVAPVVIINDDTTCTYSQTQCFLIPSFSAFRFAFLPSLFLLTLLFLEPFLALSRSLESSFAVASELPIMGAGILPTRRTSVCIALPFSRSLFF